MTQVSKTGQIAKVAINSEVSCYNLEKVAEFIQEKGTTTQKEIRDITTLKKGVVHRAIKSLINEGLIVLTTEKRERQYLYRWVGGISAIEDELKDATARQVSASLLAETYDSLILDAFAIFSILFDGHGWEVVTNLREGLTDTEIHQFLGNDVSIDSIRRILVICDAHGLIKINRIRTPSGAEAFKLFEPLFRVEFIDKDFFEQLIILRGIASAIRFERNNKGVEGYSHPFSKILDVDKSLYQKFSDGLSRWRCLWFWCKAYLKLVSSGYAIVCHTPKAATSGILVNLLADLMLNRARACD